MNQNSEVIQQQQQQQQSTSSSSSKEPQQSTKDLNQLETRSFLPDNLNNSTDPVKLSSSLLSTTSSSTTKRVGGEEEEEDEEVNHHNYTSDLVSGVTGSRPESVSSNNSGDSNSNKLKRRLLGEISGLNGVPEVSYSSSDEEDCFYDATEETPNSPSTVVGSIDAACKSIESFNINSLHEYNNMDSSTIDYDKFYEETDDEDLGSFESHGSVISHLLSQVKIGMDLTKVVLPTFILERRSLLEMYADFFAHPDLFIR